MATYLLNDFLIFVYTWLFLFTVYTFVFLFLWSRFWCEYVWCVCMCDIDPRIYAVRHPNGVLIEFIWWIKMSNIYFHWFFACHQFFNIIFPSVPLASVYHFQFIQFQKCQNKNEKSMINHLKAVNLTYYSNLMHTVHETRRERECAFQIGIENRRTIVNVEWGTHNRKLYHFRTWFKSPISAIWFTSEAFQWLNESVFYLSLSFCCFRSSILTISLYIFFAYANIIYLSYFFCSILANHFQFSHLIKLDPLTKSLYLLANFSPATGYFWSQSSI